ncbi:MAG: hypothetical protein D4R73_10960 [Deltaproteobacteria bacterium]|nr:MAG: hypothetical protein D4R73_10960 [Deltaproteobacteria bacterium]
MAGTNWVSGISSGLDWRSIIDQLRAVEHKPIDLIQKRKGVYEERLSAWQGINTKILSLKTAAGTLNKTSGFNLYTTSLSSNTTTKADDVLSVSTSTAASTGTYQIKVNQLAAAQKLSSTTYASQTTALNLSGDIIIGGRTVKVASTDTLSGLRDKINAVNTGTNASGVTASNVYYGTGAGYRLILTSDKEGAAGISLLNGGATDIVGTLGFVDASAQTAKNTVTGGHKSDALAYADKAVGCSDLLNLTSAQSGAVTITINGTAKPVAIDLSTDSLNTIRDAINTAFTGVFASNPASVVSETVNGTTKYRLLIEGNTITYTDANNVLETLGILKRAGVSDEKGVTGDVANTSGGAAITSSTKISAIDGYVDWVATDKVHLNGKDADGNPITESTLTIAADTTVQNLLDAIVTNYGGSSKVAASVTADGKIQVIDKTGNGLLDVQLLVKDQGGITRTSIKFANAANGSLGTVGVVRKRQIQAGANAEITVDGVTVNPTSNTVDDVITGVTLNLKKAATDTTVTLTVGRDYDAVKEKITDFVNAYNETMDAINAQLTYDSDNKKPGGPLFGDSTLRTVKSNLTGIIVNKVTGVNDSFSTLGLIGISIGTDSKLTVNDTKLQGYLETNFDDIKKLFAADWSSTSSNLGYIYHTIDAQSGTYNVNISGVNPVAGYFATSGDATGSGEYLTGISGNAKGLTVRYSGTATGAVGSFSLTYGVAELLDRTLYHITDSVDGYIANKQETINDTIDSLGDKIDTMEARLEQKMQTMINRFITMEMALSRIQSQSTWLAGQIQKL